MKVSERERVNKGEKRVLTGNRMSDRERKGNRKREREREDVYNVSGELQLT